MPNYSYLLASNDRFDYLFPLHQNMDHSNYQFAQWALLFLQLV